MQGFTILWSPPTDCRTN